jgi:hypothetical protein
MSSFYVEGAMFPDTYHVYKYLPADTESGHEEVVAQVNYHPAYRSSYKEAGFVNATDVMFFTGRRWVIFSYRQPGEHLMSGEGQAYSNFNEMNSSNPHALVLMEGLLGTGEGVGELLIAQQDLQAENGPAAFFFAKFRPYFFSEPVDAGTPSDVLEPLGLHWFRAITDQTLEGDGWRVDESQPLETRFLCSECDSRSNPCYNQQQCNALTETCRCDRFYQGSLCERPVRCDRHACLNGGKCDSWYGYCECVSPYYGNLCQYKYQPT